MFNKKNAYSYIALCKVPITPVHQLTFKSKAEQYQYFKSKNVEIDLVIIDQEQKDLFVREVISGTNFPFLK